MLFGGGAGDGGDAIDGTRENGTNYSGSKANRREQTGFEGEKQGSVARRTRDIDVRVTGLRKPRDEVRENKK